MTEEFSFPSRKQRGKLRDGLIFTGSVKFDSRVLTSLQSFSWLSLSAEHYEVFFKKLRFRVPLNSSSPPLLVLAFEPHWVFHLSTRLCKQVGVHTTAFPKHDTEVYMNMKKKKREIIDKKLFPAKKQKSK